jgi:hypothetical protein
MIKRGFSRSRLFLDATDEKYDPVFLVFLYVPVMAPGKQGDLIFRPVSKKVSAGQ